MDNSLLVYVGLQRDLVLSVALFCIVERCCNTIAPYTEHIAWINNTFMALFM